MRAVGPNPTPPDRWDRKAPSNGSFAGHLKSGTGWHPSICYHLGQPGFRGASPILEGLLTLVSSAIDCVLGCIYLMLSAGLIKDSTDEN